MDPSETSSDEPPSEATSDTLRTSASAEDSSGTLRQGLKAQWTPWVLDVSKSLQPVLKETVIFGVFILGDLLIVWLVGFAFADVVDGIPALGKGYVGIKIASVVVITIHYLIDCIVEINKERKTIAEIFSRKDKKKEETV